MRLHVDGRLVGEKPLCPLSSEQFQDDMKKIALVGNDGNLGGYIYQVQVLPASASISDQYVKVHSYFKMSKAGYLLLFPLISTKEMCQFNNRTLQ